MEQELKIAKNLIEEILKQNGLKLIKVILFGSRARGDYEKDSDYDFFVIIDKDLTFPQKMEINTKIRRKLVENNISGDIILQCERKVEERKNNVGYLSYYVLKEGITL